RGRARGRSRAIAPPHRLRVPERRAVSTYERRRQYRDHAETAGHPRSRDRVAGRRTARSGPAGARPAPQPPAAGIVGRPAPARRRRPGARSEDAHRADGRAVRRARSPHPRCARRRLPRPAPTARADHGHYHPRHGRGGAAGRPHRGDACRAASGTGHAGRTCGQHRSLCRRVAAHAASAGRAAQRAAAAGRRGMSLLSDPRWSEALAHLPDYLGNHVRVSVTALALGLLASLPLAIAARNRPVMRGALLGLASIVQTVPGLALLALFYPLLLALAALSLSWFGFGFSAFGFLPAVLALALYSMLPVLRNTITGLRGVDAAILEAAQGVGMTPRQSLLSVELPLALPVMMAGIRTAAVWVIGTATLSTPIGQTSLGNYIFAGLQTQNWIFVLFGCIAAAALALVVDQLLALIETGLRLRSRLRVVLGGLGVAALLAATLLPSMARGPSSYIVGAKTFAEQYVLAALIAQRLQAAGLSASSREGLGSNVIFDALVSGDIDVYVDYSGTLWANQFHHGDIKPREALLAELKSTLAQRNVTLLGELGFENAYALVMPRQRADALGIHSIADLASHAPTMSIAADYEFFSRPEWAGIRKAYGLAFRTQRQMQPDFMYAAAASGEVDVIAGYTSDGLIAKYDLVVLDDPRHAIPPYDAIVLLAPKRAADRALRAALQPLLGRIDIATMREANLRAAGGNGASSPAAVARWLWEKIGQR